MNREPSAIAIIRAVLGAMAIAASPGLANAAAQSPSEMPVQPSRPVQVPLSGRPGGGGEPSVMQRTTNSGGGNTVNVINSSVTVPAPYSGSVAAGKAGSTVLPLTLADAVARGLRANLGAISQASNVRQSEGQRDIAKSELLPQVNSVVSEAFEKINLRTLGVESNTFPLTAKFNYYDARAARLNQSVFDLVRIRNLHGATETVQVNLKQARNALDLIVLAVGGSYLQLIATSARVEAATAQVEAFQAIYRQAADRLAAGLATRVDATRSQVQLQTEQQRLRSLRADFDTQKLRLARIIGLPPAQPFVIVDSYPFTPLMTVTEESSLIRAQADRSDLQAAALAVHAAALALKAAQAEHLPSVAVNGDFGAAGLTPSRSSVGVFNVSGTLTIPLFEGGRIHGDVEVAQAALRQRQAEFDDLRGQVDQDVRQAFIDLNSAADQVDVAKSNVTLAHETLTQSRDRFAAGIADTVEVVQAEQSVVQADDDLITAVFEHNLAKVSLARAVGNTEQTLAQLLTK